MRINNKLSTWQLWHCCQLSGYNIYYKNYYACSVTFTIFFLGYVYENEHIFLIIGEEDLTMNVFIKNTKKTLDE